MKLAVNHFVVATYSLGRYQVECAKDSIVNVGSQNGENGTILDFSCAGFGEGQDHLKVVKQQVLEMGVRLDIFKLVLVISLRYSDLLVAMDEYVNDMYESQELAEIFWDSFTKRRINDVNEAEIRRKPYIQDSDL